MPENPDEEIIAESYDDDTEQKEEERNTGNFILFFLIIFCLPLLLVRFYSLSSVIIVLHVKTYVCSCGVFCHRIGKNRVKLNVCQEGWQDKLARSSGMWLVALIFFVFSCPPPGTILLGARPPL